MNSKKHWFPPTDKRLAMEWNCISNEGKHPPIPMDFPPSRLFFSRNIRRIEILTKRKPGVGGGVK